MTLPASSVSSLEPHSPASLSGLRWRLTTYRPLPGAARQMCFSADLQPLSHSVSQGSQCCHRHCALGVSADVPPLLKAAPTPWLLLSGHTPTARQSRRPVGSFVHPPPPRVSSIHEACLLASGGQASTWDMMGSCLLSECGPEKMGLVWVSASRLRFSPGRYSVTSGHQSDTDSS